MGSQSYTAIKSALFDSLERASGRKVADNHKVMTHIGKRDADLDTFLDEVNNLPRYRSDGLFLTPAKVPPAASVDQLLTAVVQNYRDRGWVVTLP